jgi:hypothetical protein
MVGLYGIAVWLLAAPMLATLGYFLLKPTLESLSRS